MSLEKRSSGSRSEVGIEGSMNVTSRTVAILVLVPTVPMLLASIAALALFYLAPTRFGNLIARLPGETFIRTALVFAPATLFAVVVLAALYALEKPERQRIPAQGVAGIEKVEALEIKKEFLYLAPKIARIVLLVAVPALLVSAALWALSFVSPGRFDRLMEPLPGDRYLRPLVGVAPILLFFLVLVAASFVFAGERPVRRRIVPEHLTRRAVHAVLVSAVPALLLSVAVLALSYLSSNGFERLIKRIPFDEFLRLALAFAPVVLLAVVLLSLLYLRQPRVEGVPLREGERSSRKTAQKSQLMRSQLAMWVLVGGLTLSAIAGLSLLGTVIYLVFR
ncbi:MAG: hypothetical protein GTO14_21725 [Anaerolineales bacterium]|nr:hypothetical protein [Anaerolineales bacterium]